MHLVIFSRIRWRCVSDGLGGCGVSCFGFGLSAHFLFAPFCLRQFIGWSILLYQLDKLNCIQSGFFVRLMNYQKFQYYQNQNNLFSRFKIRLLVNYRLKNSQRQIMNDQVISDIQKHNNKVTRILNKLCQKHPGLTQEIDLALYSCLKIQKILKKHNQNHKSSNGNKDSQHTIGKNINVESQVSPNEDDQLYSNALTLIEGFKTATQKLQNKVGILLRQQKLARQVQRAKQNNNMNLYDQDIAFNPNGLNSRDNTIKGKRRPIPTSSNTSPFSPHIIQNSNSKRKNKPQSDHKRNQQSGERHKRRVKDYMEESQSFEEIDEGQKSKNISELDLEIIELASKIKNLIREN